jgi:hypothetical protein
MATTYTLISSQTLASSAASVTFSAIPSTYTDLVIKVSSRTNNVSTSSYLIPTWNTDTGTNYSNTMFYTNDGGSVASGNESSVSPSTNNYNTRTNGAGSTSNTFTNTEIYIPSYTVSQYKPLSQFGVQENNATTGIFLCTIASLWRNTAAISQLSFTPYGSDIFVAGSSFYLYGISNA